jgi:hypothetical protein
MTKGETKGDFWDFTYVSEDAGVEPRNVESSVVDPWHFSVDSDPDTRIHASD